MWSILFLLLPVAFLFGWFLGNKNRSVIAKRGFHNYFSGFNHLLNEQPDKAVASFLQALNSDDELIETHLALGNLFRKRGEVDRAIRIHQALLARPTLDNKLKALAHFELGKDFIIVGMLDRAEEIFFRLIKEGIHVESSMRYLLEIYQQGHEWNKAIEITKKLQKQSKEDLSHLISQFYCEMIESQLRDGNINNINQYINLALRTNPRCARVSILQGNIDMAATKYKKALNSYKRVYKQNIDYFSEVLPKIAECYTKLDNEDGYIKYLEGCIEQFPMKDLALELADGINTRQSSESAVRYISNFLQKDPSLYGLSKVISLYKEQPSSILRNAMQNLQQIVDQMLHKEAKYRCSNCGFFSRSLEWYCPGCRQWETIKNC